MVLSMVVEILSPLYYGIIHKYKLSSKQLVLYQDIVQDQPLSSKVIHKLLANGVLTNQIKEL